MSLKIQGKDYKSETLWDNAVKHFKTITHHRHEVIKNCFRAGIGFQGLFHDLSKYTPEEFVQGMLHYQGTRSPNEGEREEYGYSKAWMHHKGRNKHHYEYWNDYNKVTKRVEAVPMPTRYFVEMICDRIAASKIYMGENYTDASPLNYFESRHTTGAQILIHPKTEAHLHWVLKLLAEKGEKRTFRYLRKIVRRDKNA